MRLNDPALTDPALTDPLSPPPPVRRPRIGRLAIQVGVAFALAMAAVGLVGFIVAERWVAHRI
ncbi:hypothetical protein ABTF44_21905, partial [Acinetobacter baumannii]